MQEQSPDKSGSGKGLFDSLFLEHPRQAGETYWQHFLFTVGMAVRLGSCAIALLIHGTFPFLFVHTTSKKMNRANAILRERADKTMQAAQDSNWII